MLPAAYAESHISDIGIRTNRFVVDFAVVENVTGRFAFVVQAADLADPVIRQAAGLDLFVVWILPTRLSLLETHPSSMNRADEPAAVQVV